MDKERFLNSIAAVSTDSGIGTLGEKTLHSVIKRYIEPNPECREVKVVGRIVADIYNSDGITEIQTRNYFALRKKLPKLLEIAHVTVVLPLPATKWVSWIDPETGDVSKRRKSPKSGRPHDGLYELSKIKDFGRPVSFRCSSSLQTLNPIFAASRNGICRSLPLVCPSLV